MRLVTHLATAAAAIFTLAGAHAATVYSAGPTGALPTDSSVTASFSAAAGAGSVDLQLAGYNTLDGDNFYIDIFHITVNGSDVFSGTWNLGGGGTNRILNDPNGASVGAVMPPAAGQSGTIDISVPVTFSAGTNTVVFSYESPTVFEGSARAGFQGLGDEAWAMNHASITAAVPEPGSYALMLGGLALLGAAARRRARG